MKRFFRDNRSKCLGLNCDILVPANIGFCKQHGDALYETYTFYKDLMFATYPDLEPLTGNEQIIRITHAELNGDLNKAVRKLTVGLSEIVIYNQVLIHLIGRPTPTYKNELEYFRRGEFAGNDYVPTEIVYFTPNFNAKTLVHRVLKVTKRPGFNINIKKRLITGLIKLFVDKSNCTPIYNIFVYTVNSLNHDKMSKMQISGANADNAKCYANENIVNELCGNLLSSIDILPEESVISVMNAMALTQIHFRISIANTLLAGYLEDSKNKYAIGKQAVINAALSEISFRGNTADKIQELLAFIQNCLKINIDITLSSAAMAGADEVKGVHIHNSEDLVGLYNSHSKKIAGISFSYLKKAIQHNAEIVHLSFGETDIFHGRKTNMPSFTTTTNLTNQYILSCSSDIYREHGYDQTMDTISRLCII